VTDDRGSGSRQPDDRRVTAPDDSPLWHAQPPVLRGRDVILREATRGDAFSLFSVFSHPEVVSATAPGPRSPAEFADLIETAAVDRRTRRGIWFAVIPHSAGVAGLIRLREIEPEFKSAEWEMVLAHQQWGTGIFVRAASLTADFVFDVLRATRLEARVAVSNGRAQAALRKLGARQEAVLRQSMQFASGASEDQGLLTLFADDWRARRDIIRKIH
jgi:RimJ/RimL family protein N-acetyltransferase